MSANSLGNMSVFDFVDDVDAFIDEWYDFHEEVYLDSPSLEFISKPEYMKLNPVTKLSKIEDEFTEPSVNINKTLKYFNEKVPFGLTTINFPSRFSGKEIFDSPFSDDNMFKDAA